MAGMERFVNVRFGIVRIGEAGSEGIGLALRGALGLCEDRYGRKGKKTTMSNYKFINPSLWKGVTVDAAVEELDRIRNKNGILKPEMVVEESRDENAILHKCFQWDDTKAADLWRKEQARKLITNITCIVVNETVECRIRAYVNVTQDEKPERSYIPTTEAILDNTAYIDLWCQAKAEMESFITKYQQISELNGVKAEMLAALNAEVKLPTSC